MTDHLPSKQERDAFEAWAVDKFSTHRHAFHPHRYLLDSTNLAWKAWQARADIQLRELQSLREDIQRAESARVAILAENEHYKTELARVTGEREPPHCSTCSCGMPGQCMPVFDRAGRCGTCAACGKNFTCGAALGEQRPFSAEEAKAYQGFIEEHFEPASSQPPGDSQ